MALNKIICYFWLYIHFRYIYLQTNYSKEGKNIMRQRRKGLRTIRKRVVLYLRMDTLEAMKKAADSYRMPLVRYAESLLVVNSMWIIRKQKEFGL